MALNVRKLNGPMIIALVTGFNLLKRELTERETSFPHYDVTSIQTGSEDAPTSAPQSSRGWSDCRRHTTATTASCPSRRLNPA